MELKRLIHLFLLFVILLSLFPASVAANRAYQESSPQAQAALLLANMSAEERVGQLFLITFQGSEFTSSSPIHDLITNYHIGGVVLLAENDNFVAAPNTAQKLYELSVALQRTEANARLVPVIDAFSRREVRRNQIPLFIGISQDGDGYPSDALLDGISPVPSLMAVGATWQPELAEKTGFTLGSELSTLGINLYFGPALDVLTSPKPAGGGDPGVGVFGGDPFWVGEMGRAYISGLHQGSNGRMAVIAKHFPGRGDADRLTGEEVATVRKSLEQLKQVELAPFFAVTGNTPASHASTDGLLVSHIRYQGFQGNIRATTKPVSFDGNALTEILQLPAFSSWREQGGLIVSDNLGSQAVHRFYDPSGQQDFFARLVARDAFLAGSDLLYMGNIVSSDQVDTYATMVQTLQFFSQKYREDEVFAQRVDQSVLRILTRKYQLYNNFNLLNVLPGEADLKNVGNSPIAAQVAREAVTLVSPGISDLDAVLFGSPNIRERILFITDHLTTTQCSDCPEQTVLGVQALEDAVLRLYGPSTGGQVVVRNLSSYSFEDLERMLNGEHPGLQLDFERANWVVIITRSLNQNQVQYQVLNRLLSQQENQLREKRVVLFALGAPYYLDATDISKLTAYYALYSKTPAFVDVAARVLFQEASAMGALPVSVSGVGYELLVATSPNPRQVIELHLDIPAVATPVAGDAITPEPTPIPVYRMGDMLMLRTGVILDHNQNPVPDGTVVRFNILFSTDAGTNQQLLDAFTTQGIARVSYRLENAGSLEVRALSEPAITSVSLQLTVTSEGSSVVVVAPTPAPTEIIIIEPGGQSPTPTIATETTSQEQSLPGLTNWFLMLILLAFGSVVSYNFGIQRLSMRWGIRWALSTILGGTLAYIFSAGVFSEMVSNPVWALGLVALGMVLGLAAGWVWSSAIAIRKRPD